MNEQNDLIEKLNKLQIAIQRACPKVEKKSNEEHLEKKKQNKSAASQKRTKLSENEQNRIEKQFVNYLMEQKLNDTIKKIMLTKNMQIWRKKLGRKVLLRGIGNQNTSQRKPKGKKKGTSKKSQTEPIEEPKSQEMTQQSYNPTEEEENTEEILEFANKIIEEKKKQMKNFDDGIYSPHIYENQNDVPSSQPELSETTALLSDEQHIIKNPFIVSKTLDFSDSDDEFLHSNGNNNKRVPTPIEDVSPIDPKSETLNSEQDFQRKTKPVDLEKTTDRVLINKEILNDKSSSSSRSVSSSVIFETQSGKKKPKFSFKNDDLFAISPSESSSIKQPSSSVSSTKVPSFPPDQNSTNSLIKRVNNAINLSSSGTDKFDSLVEKAQKLLMESSQNIEEEDERPEERIPLEKVELPPVEIENEKIPKENSEIASVNSTPINSAQSTPSKESSLNSPQPISPESSKNNDSVTDKNSGTESTELKNNSNSMMDSINTPSEDEDIAEFERRISALTSSSRAAIILDDDGEVIDVDNYLKTIGYQLNKPQDITKIEPDAVIEDDDDDEEKIDRELAALQKSLRKAIDSTSHADDHDDDIEDFEYRISKLML